MDDARTPATEYENQSQDLTEEEQQALQHAESLVRSASPEESESGPSEKARKKAKANKRKKRRRAGRRFLRFLILVGICVGLYYFAISDFFTIKEIQVTGNKYYTRSQVSVISGLKTGYNLFTTDLSEAKDNLLNDPYIRLASIKRVLPNTLRIEIEERLEYAAVPYGEQYILIDDDGMVLWLSDNKPVLPLLEGMTIADMTPGSPLTVEQSYLLTETLQMIHVMEENDLYFKKINFSLVIVKAYIYDDYYIEGTPENITDNMQRIHQLIEEHYKQGITRGVIRVSKGSYMAFDPQIN
ncbi:MAG: FtsQ-type POTRA domain-containing protein [Firmicutes bacterium]|nr:FtsQ-type POTRA domain-containing protein [Bacillota bacterium]